MMLRVCSAMTITSCKTNGSSNVSPNKTILVRRDGSPGVVKSQMRNLKDPYRKLLTALSASAKEVKNKMQRQKGTEGEGWVDKTKGFSRSSGSRRMGCSSAPLKALNLPLFSMSCA